MIWEESHSGLVKVIGHISKTFPRPFLILGKVTFDEQVKVLEKLFL